MLTAPGHVEDKDKDQSKEAVVMNELVEDRQTEAMTDDVSQSTTTEEMTEPGGQVDVKKGCSLD